MKAQTTTNIAISSSVALALALAIWSPAQSTSATPEPAKLLTEEKMKSCCGAMKTQMGRMKADVKAQDDELTEQVAKMNGASNDEKLDAMATVITRMAEDRIVMNGNMDILHMAMRQHIMQHMSIGKESISGCSMMKGMDEKSADTLKAPK